MLNNLKSVVFKIADLNKAKSWYNNILKTNPVYESSDAVFYSIGESSLVLSQNTGRLPEINNKTIIYWAVNNIYESYNELIKNGAVSYSDINEVMGIKKACVVDPFGNILGLIDANNIDKRSVENKPSETAQSVAFLRAFANRDSKLQGPDYIAELFLNEEQKSGLKNTSTRQWVLENKIPKGTYEFISARTFYFDEVFKNALINNIPQIVLLGAGYDTRSYRFKDLIKQTTIFELDINTTQQRKQELLKSNNIIFPKQLKFAPINFKTDSIDDVLFKAGYDNKLETVFIWEGVIYYLKESAVKLTLKSVKNNLCNSSRIIFDYISISNSIKNSTIMKEHGESMKNSHPAEPILFKIEDGKISSFLKDNGFIILEHLNANQIEKKYLSLKNDTTIGNIPEFFNFATAWCKY